MVKDTIKNVARTIVESQSDDGVTAQDLAFMLEVTVTAAYHLLKRLENLGFLNRDVTRKPYVWTFNYTCSSDH